MTVFDRIQFYEARVKIKHAILLNMLCRDMKDILKKDPN